MATDVKPIRNEADYQAALDVVAALWGSPGGTPAGDQLDVLATLIDAYEARCHPMDPPDPVEAIKFRMEQQGRPARTWKTSSAPAHAWRGAEPQAQPVDRHDPQVARPVGDFG